MTVGRMGGSSSQKISAERTLRAPRVVDIHVQEMSLYEALKALFEFRHHLVHEISASLIGAFPLRSAWSLSEAKIFATSVLTCITSIESNYYATHAV